VETNGKYYDQCELTDFSSQADDRVLCKKLWDVSAELTGLGG
ncbi:MAG: short-chain dehydrogenase, partial [Gammaproteobacteria bacterium]|nr:short-chain dehydrogenase [Gammaproteobacteria bacterium]